MHKLLLILTIILSLTFGAAAQNETVEPSLVGSEWLLVSTQAQGTLMPAYDGVGVTLNFTEQGEYNGNSGCNLYHGSYTQDGALLSLGAAASTRMACIDENANAQESDFLAALATVTGYQTTGNRLSLITLEGIRLNFVAHGAYALAGSTWTLDSYGPDGAETAAISEAVPTLSFISTTEIAAHGGCNGFGSAFGVDGDYIAIEQGVGTLIACDEAVMTQEATYIDLLTSAIRYEQAGHKLTLYTEAGDVLRFTASDAYALTVGGWQLVEFVTDGEAAPVIDGTSITLEFLPDGLVTGNASCNIYGGSYVIDGENVTLSRMVSTLMACLDENVMQQEMHYLDMLNSVERYTLDGENLTLHTASGDLHYIAVDEI